MTVLRLTLPAFLILALFTMSLSARAQQARLYRVGVLLLGDPHSSTMDGLRDGLKELGLEEAKQFVFDVRDGKGDLRSVEAAARNLEAAKVDVIVAMSTSITLAAKRATQSVPIVFYAGTDPVSTGLVESLPRPGGRLTGTHSQSSALTAKRLELLKQMVPWLRRVVTFYRPDSPAGQQAAKIARGAARQLKLELVERKVTSVEELRVSLRALQPREADALLYIADTMVNSQAALIIATAREKRLPTMFSSKENVAKGALAGYGESYYAIGRLCARYVQRVLLGADPADLPVEQADSFHFVINLQTAKALGLTIPQSLLARADEVIE